MTQGVVGGATVLGKLSVQGRPTIWIIVGQGPTALAVGADGVVWTFFLSSIISLFLLPLSLWDTARLRLKYCLKGPLSPNQPTNQHFMTQVKISILTKLCPERIPLRAHDKERKTVHTSNFRLFNPHQ